MIRTLQELSTFLRLKVDSVSRKHCLLCLQTGQGSHFCEGCLDDLPHHQPGCQICGEWLPSNADVCGHCLTERPFYQACLSAFEYAFPIDQLIRQLKYHDQGYWADALADAAWPTLHTLIQTLERPVLVPVPMHSAQYRSRRYNHAELLAWRYAARARLPLLTNLVKKSSKTPRQAELSGSARRKNLKSAFQLNPKIPLQGITIILVDDVTTTGTTINRVARLLRQHGAKEVFGFTLAKRSLQG